MQRLNKVPKDIIYRTGFGFDLHRFEKRRKLFIGGAEIKYDKGFAGHSDGDVVLHAVCDAALGAVCAGDLGVYFPSSNKKIKGISSAAIAKRVVEILKKKKARVVHIDATLITESPRMQPHYKAVRQSMDKIFGIGFDNISFKSKSHEGIGEIGRGEAAMCQCAVTVKIERNS
ncbi:MAG: 2-C-methyl-D-erythritol 2,4-cyclodiphosphate synthase [Elusimicrobia bacterium]|nr:2-C-methyl-D-erythritol 2,4-cyclodiphosphate synthase [Elusimicrobiota bacterium]